jgi:hypothetical protein
MKTATNFLGPVLLILLTSLIVTLAILPLAGTGFAEGIRVNETVGDEESGFGGDAEFGMMPTMLHSVLEFVKGLAMMGIAGFITYAILRVVRRFTRKRRITMSPG